MLTYSDSWRKILGKLGLYLLTVLCIKLPVVVAIFSGILFCTNLPIVYLWNPVKLLLVAPEITILDSLLVSLFISLIVLNIAVIGVGLSVLLTLFFEEPVDKNPATKTH